jgi:RHS repeat-associated protein
LTSLVGNPFAHQGLPFDAETQHYLVRRRMLDPILTTWGCRDPANQDPRRGAVYIDGMSPYVYVGSAPTRYRDPSGLTMCCLGVRGNIGINCFIPCPISSLSCQSQAESAGWAAANAVESDHNSTHHEAVRHCVASGVLATCAGCPCARCSGDVREDYQNECEFQNQREGQRAKNNNQAGRYCAGCVGDGAASNPLHWGDDERWPSRPPPVADLQSITACCNFLWRQGRLDGGADAPPHMPGDPPPHTPREPD